MSRRAAMRFVLTVLYLMGAGFTFALLNRNGAVAPIRDCLEGSASVREKCFQSNRISVSISLAAALWPATIPVAIGIAAAHEVGTF